MDSVEWLLHNDRPQIEIVISLPGTGREQVRRLLADTGAGTRTDVFELILDEDDCSQCGGIPMQQVRLSGAFKGEFPVYLIDIRISAVGFDNAVPVVGVPKTPKGFDGLACFRFLSRFSYGNLNNSDGFTLRIQT